MIKNNLLTKILIILGLAFSVSTFVSADRTANGVPGDGVLGKVLVSLGGGDSAWTATSSLGITSTVYTGTYPIIVTGSVISTGFSTSTINVFSAKQTFGNASSTSFTGDTLYSTTGIFGTGTFSSTLGVTGKTTLANASSTSLTVSGQTYLATTTVTGDVSVSGNIPNRVVGYTSSSTITINVDTTDEATTTVNQTTTFANPTGTPVDGFMYLMTLRATTTQTISWGTSFASSTDLNAPLTIASGTTEVLWKYDKYRNVYMLLGLLKTFMN